jgi:hypothetical protein
LAAAVSGRARSWVYTHAAGRFKVFGGIENLDRLDWTDLRFKEFVSE